MNSATQNSMENGEQNILILGSQPGNLLYLSAYPLRYTTLRKSSVKTFRPPFYAVSFIIVFFLANLVFIVFKPIHK